MSYKKFISLILFFLAFNGHGASEKVSSVPFINMILTFETQDENNSIIHDVVSAIHETIPVICSMAIFYQFMNIPLREDLQAFSDEAKHSCMSGSWSVFKSKDDQYVVLLPESYTSLLLNKYGLNMSLEYVAPNILEETFSTESLKNIYETQKNKLQYMVDHFGDLFDANVTENIAKRIYLFGHGSPDGIVAGLPINLLMSILSQLNKLHCEFLIVSTCYFGGYNLINLQKEIEKAMNDYVQRAIKEQVMSEKKELSSTQVVDYPNIQQERRIVPFSFPIVCMATTDEIILSKNVRFGTFFSHLDRYLKNPTYYFNRERNLSDITIKELLFMLTEGPLHIVSIRFPGVHSYFRTVTTGHIQTITWADVAGLTLEAKLYNIKFPMSTKVPIITIKDFIEYVLIYPVNLQEITIKFEQLRNKKVFVISKIPGQAQHFIGTVESQDEVDLRSLFIPKFFKEMEGEQEKSYYGKNPKAWFISKSLVNGQENFGVVLYKGYSHDKSGIPYVLALRKGSDGTYALAKGLSGEYEPISPAAYYWMIKSIFDSTRAVPDSLKEATAGNETSLNEQEAFEKFLSQLALQIPQNDEGIQEYVDLLGEYFDKVELPIAAYRRVTITKLFTATNRIRKKLLPLLEKPISYEQEKEILDTIIYFIEKNLAAIQGDAFTTEQIQLLILKPLFKYLDQKPSSRAIVKERIEALEKKYMKKLL